MKDNTVGWCGLAAFVGLVGGMSGAGIALIGWQSKEVALGFTFFAMLGLLALSVSMALAKAEDCERHDGLADEDQAPSPQTSPRDEPAR